MSARPVRGLTRQEALGAALATGGAVVGGALLGGAPDEGRSARQRTSDVSALNEVLRLERIQAAFYADAVRQAALTGELAVLAEALAGQEQEHVAAITRLLGANAERAPRTRFGDATRDAEAFARAAQQLEDLAARSYNVQVLPLRGRPLRELLRIVSVEARHAAWIRDIRGANPAPHAVEPPISSAKARAALDRTGFLG